MVELAVSRTFWWRHLWKLPNTGSKEGARWTIFGLSDTYFPIWPRIFRKRWVAALLCQLISTLKMYDTGGSPQWVSDKANYVAFLSIFGVSSTLKLYNSTTFKRFKIEARDRRRNCCPWWKEFSEMYSAERQRSSSFPIYICCFYSSRPTFVLLLYSCHSVHMPTLVIIYVVLHWALTCIAASQSNF